MTVVSYGVHTVALQPKVWTIRIINHYGKVSHELNLSTRPRKFQVGYGPNLSALVQGLITLGLSRRDLLEFLHDNDFVRTSHGEGLRYPMVA